MEAAVTIAALPVAALALWALVRAPAAARLVALPTGERWHERADADVRRRRHLRAGFVGRGRAGHRGRRGRVRRGELGRDPRGLHDRLRRRARRRPPSPEPDREARRADRRRGDRARERPRVEIVGERRPRVRRSALLWLVGITNAFNLLDNMDGLAATLATVACALLRDRRGDRARERHSCSCSRSRSAFACARLPSVQPPAGRRAACSWATPGASCSGSGSPRSALAASWTVGGDDGRDDPAAAPRARDPDPRHDARHDRAARREAARDAGRDATTRRTGSSTTASRRRRPSALLAIIAIALGATALAYNVLDNGRLTAIGVLVTFVLLVQFGGFLGDLEERARGADGPATRRSGTRSSFEPRRLVEVLVDFVAHLRVVPRRVPARRRRARAPSSERSVVPGRAADPPRRRATSSSSRSASTGGCGGTRPRATSSRSRSPRASRRWSRSAILVALRAIGDVPGRAIFVVDARPLHARSSAPRGSSLRLVPEAGGGRDDGRRRVLVVGAGRAGRGLARELRESRDVRVVGFLDDNPRAAPAARSWESPSLGSLDEAEAARSRATRADEVARDDPRRAGRAARRGRRASASAAGVPCRIVRARAPSSAPTPRERRRVSAHVTAAPPRGERARRPLARVQSACRCSSAYFALAALYAWQAWRRETPTIFTDELELTQLSRAIAETGEPARRGEPYGFATLVAYAPRAGLVARLGRDRVRSRSRLVLVLAMTGDDLPCLRASPDASSRPAGRCFAAAGAAIAVPGARLLADPRRGAARLPGSRRSRCG